jgi:hypothetical protein
MTVESAADRLALLADFAPEDSTGDKKVIKFSPGATFPNRNQSTVDVVGIFDNEYLSIAADGPDIDARQPALLCRSADVTDAVNNSMVEIGSAVYKVVGVEPDGTGITALALEGPR